MGKPLGIRLVDLCKPDPYKAYARFQVGDGAAFMIICAQWGAWRSGCVGLCGEMKCHSTTGVTLSLKNLIGLAPTSEYRRNISENNRSAFHESTDFDKRLPAGVIDLNQACPVHLALIDG